MERLFHIRTNRKAQICHGTQTFYRILQPSPVGLGCLFCLFKNQQRKCLLNQSGTVADHIKHPSLWNRTIRHFLPSLPVDWLKQLLLLLRWHSLSVNWFQSFTFKLCFFVLNSISFNIITKMPISSIQQPYLSAKFILNLDQIKNIKKIKIYRSAVILMLSHVFPSDIVARPTQWLGQRNLVRYLVGRLRSRFPHSPYLLARDWSPHCGATACNIYIHP